ncbi:MAG: DUF1440 domain-containing protein [Verrucomicrobiota bacterium]|nr:DUF1440 domain-containing protein [Verrucomicrobiota bacterium]
MKKTAEPDLLKGLAAGIAGGLLASLVMEQFQNLWTMASEASQRAEGKEPARSKAKPATVKAADAISRQVVGHKVREQQQKLAGEAVHYAMGGASGAIYGALAEFIDVASAGQGLAFGASVWLLADEVSVPALGLSKPPTKIPVATHLYALASHFVYGAVTEAVRRAVRSVL